MNCFCAVFLFSDGNILIEMEIAMCLVTHEFLRRNQLKGK